ncbi:proteoglycan 4 [Pelodytes ibericus]
MELKNLNTQLVFCFLVFLSTGSAQSDTSCIGRCGEGYSRDHDCHCDYNCMSFMECCQDFKAVCTTEASCKGRCHEGFIRGQNCDCDPNCKSYGRCCSDYEAVCAKPIQRRSPAPPPASLPVSDERDRTPDPTRRPNEANERTDEPQENPDQDTETTPSTDKTRSPSKKPSKNPPKKPTKKNKKQKKKTIEESEEEIEESEENVSSSSFSSSSSSSTLKGSKTTKKLSRKKKPGDDDDDPDAEPKDPKKKRPPTDDEGKPKKPKTRRVMEGDDDPEGPDAPPEDPNKKRPRDKDGKPKNPKIPRDKEGDDVEDPNSEPKEPNQKQPNDKDDKPKKPKNPKEKEGDDDPDGTPKEPNQRQPDDKEDKPKKPKNPKEKEGDDDPDGTPKEPNQRQPNDKDDKPKKPKNPKEKEGDDDPAGTPKEPNQRQPDDKDDKPKKPKNPKEKEGDDDPDGTPKEPNQRQPDDKDDKPKKPKNPKEKEGDDDPDGTPKEPNQRQPNDKDDKNPKEKEGDDDPDGTPKEPNQRQPDDKDNRPKKPKNPKEKEGDDNPDGTPKEPNPGISPLSLPDSPKRPRDKDDKLRNKLIIEEDENENIAQEDSAGNLSSSLTKKTKKRSPGTRNKGPKNPDDDEDDDPLSPGKGKNPKNKPSSKDIIKKKKKVNSEEERQETVQSEFSSSSQSSTSHRRSKSTSRRLSGKNKTNIKEKNKKKIPDEDPLMPPQRRKEKDPTPEPTFGDTGSGDDGSGMDFFQTTPSTTTLVNLMTTKDSQSTATRTSTPEQTVRTSTHPITDVTANKDTTSSPLSTVSRAEYTSRNPTNTNMPTEPSTIPEEKNKEPTTTTEKAFQLTSTLTTLQEQTTTDAISNHNSPTTISQGLQEATSKRLNNISTGPTISPSFTTSNDKYSTSTPPTNEGQTTLKASVQSDAPVGSTVSISPVTKMPDTANPSMETNENRISTETPPTTGAKLDGTTKATSEISPSTAPTPTSKVSYSTYPTPLETVDPLEKGDDTGAVSTVVNLKDTASPKTTIKPLEQRTTSPDKSGKFTTERPTGDTDISNLPKSTPNPDDLEQRQTPTDTADVVATTKQTYKTTKKDNTSANMRTTTKSSTLRYSTKTTPNEKDAMTQRPLNSITARPIGIEELENNKTSFPLPLDPFHICDLLKDTENRMKLPAIDLQHLTEICNEMKQHLPVVSTPTPQTRQPNTDQRKIPPSHTITTVIERNWNQPPGSRIIQIVEEIKRRANVPQIPNLSGIPGQYTNKSTAWLLLLNKFRTPNDPQMNLCNGQPADGMTTLQNGSMVIFRGHYFWMLNQAGVLEKPRKISEVWGIPSPIDTVFTRCNCGGKTFFFKGPHYWRFSNDVMDTGYPKQIIKGFGGLKGKVTAVLTVSGIKTRPESVYFFKNGGNVQKYTFRQQQPKKCTKRTRPNVQYPIYGQNIQTVKYRFPRNIVRHRIQIQRTYPIKQHIQIVNVNQAPLGVLHDEVSVRSTWRGVPDNIVSAVSLPNPQKQDGFDYFVFSKEKYYNINMSSKVAVKPPPNAEQKTSKDWYQCKE